MVSATDVRKRLPEYREWLIAHGASLLEPTNPYELVRFKGDNGTSVMYCSNKGNVSHVGDSRECWEALFKVHLSLTEGLK